MRLLYNLTLWSQEAAPQASWTAYAHEDIMFCAVLFGFFVVGSGVLVLL